MHFKKFIFPCFWVCLAAAIQGFGMYNIHSISGITEGGILGAVLLIHHWTGLSPAISGFFLNCGCYFLGWKTLPKQFLLYSFFAAGGYSIGYGVSEQFSPIWPAIADIPLLAAIVGSLFVGISTGVCVRIGAAICGDDALAMSLNSLTHVPIQWFYLISDLTVLLLSLSYIPVQRIAYSLLTVILSGQIIGFLQKTSKTSSAGIG